MWLPPTLLLLSLPGYFSIQGPKSVSGPEQGSLTVQCHYEPGWENYKKWWCQGRIWDRCKILIESTGSEQEVKKNRLSIRDNQKNHVFTVTLEQLRQDDAGTYWCGIKRSGPDLGVQVKVTIDPEKTTPATQADKPSDLLATSSTSYIRTRFILLAFVKVPILLILLGAVLWLKGSQRVPEEQ